MSAEHPDMTDVEAILSDPHGRHFRDLRDRAAYVFVTGTFPTHLRVFFTRVLAVVSTTEMAASTFAGRAGSLTVAPAIAMRLGLTVHPMVVKVREYVERGYRIRISKGANERKPYYKVWVFKGEDQRTIKFDGSILEGWA
jgi:hypothetical protein